MGVSLRLVKPVINEFGCQLVYLEHNRDMIYSVETEPDSSSDEAIISR